jgi:hypothetical protein
VSVHPEPGPRGAIVYRVRWREGGRGSPARCRTFDHEDDAREFDRRVRRLKQTGDPALFADEVTLREYVHGEWWPNYAERRLALSTQESHSIDLDLRILLRLGDLPLARVRPSAVERFAADLERAGVGRSGRTWIRRSASAPKPRRARSGPLRSRRHRAQVNPGAAASTCSPAPACFTGVSWRLRRTRWRWRKALVMRQALCRTRTDDPFLTMEVLYQLS